MNFVNRNHTQLTYLCMSCTPRKMQAPCKQELFSLLSLYYLQSLVQHIGTHCVLAELKYLLKALVEKTKSEKPFII